MLNKYKMFTREEQNEIKNKFYFVDKDISGNHRLYFNNSGGSFRLKRAEEKFHEVDSIPDCAGQPYSVSQYLLDTEQKGKEDVRIIFNAQGGAIYPGYTASQVMFELVRVISEHAAGSNMVTSMLEHPSAFDAVSYYAEKTQCELRVADADPLTGGVDADAILSLIDKNTALLCVMAASNISGYIYDIKKIVTQAKAINPDIYIIVDAVQHAPHGVLDISGLNIDAINFASYKFFGVKGVGFAFISDRAAGLVHHKLKGKADSDWELGTPAPAHYAALSEVVDYICRLGQKDTDTDSEDISSKANRRTLFAAGMNRIAEHERGLLHLLLNGTEKVQGLRAMKGVTVCVDNGDLSRRNLITGIVFDDLNCTDAVSEFAKRNVIVHERAVSSLYSQRILTSYGLNSLIRVSPLHCHSQEDIEAFLQITQDIIAESRTGRLSDLSMT